MKPPFLAAQSRVTGLTWGHDVRDWNAGPFHRLVTDALNDLMANPGPEAAK